MLKKILNLIERKITGKDLQKVAGVILFIRNKNKCRFLLLKNKKNKWDFPKGKVDRNESILKAGLRELFEETGIDKITIIDGFFEKVKYRETKKSGKVINKAAYFYLAHTRKEKITLSEEHINYKWTDYKKALELISYAGSKDLLRYANLYLKKINEKRM